MMRIGKKMISKKNKKVVKNLEYKLEAYPGESIKEYAKRLIDHFREVSKNKLACYAEFVSGKRSENTRW